MKFPVTRAVLDEAACVHCGREIQLCQYGSPDDPLVRQWEHRETTWRACSGGMKATMAFPATKGNYQ